MAGENKEKSKILRVVSYLFLIGLVGILVIFIAGSWSGSGAYGILAASLWFLFANSLLVKRFWPGRWFSGVVINLPLFLFFIFAAEPGQFKANIWGLIICLAASYLGAFAGRWLHEQKSAICRRTLAIALLIAIAFLLIMFFVAQRPTPIPGDKQQFIGRWKASSGFELQIQADGNARIINNKFGTPNLNIAVGPSGTIDGLTAKFVGDSVLEIVKPAYFARDYKVDQQPSLDSSRYIIILNGITLKKE